MKQFLYLILFFSSFFTTCFSSDNPFLAQIIALKSKNYFSEGFLADTPVQTPKGLKKIQDIVVDNEIFISQNYEVVTEYIQIQINDYIIRVGCLQQFYLADENTWIAAQDLKKDDWILCANNQKVRINYIQRIQQKPFSTNSPHRHMHCVFLN